MTPRTGSLSDLDTLLTWREASTAGDAIAAAVRAAGDADGDAAARLLAASGQVVVTGAGSSYYLAQAVAAAARAVVHRPFVAVPLSELLLRPAGVLVSATPGDEPVVVISRSGSTSEAVAVLEAVRAAGHPTIVVTCRSDSPLAARSDVTLVSPAGDEVAVVMTRSFASMLAMLLWLVARVAGDARLERDLERATERWPEVVAAAELGHELGGTAWSRVVILGGGARYGIAAEWGLKLLETSQVPTHAYEPLEFRHGPISVCEPGVLVVGLVGGDEAAEEARVLVESSRLGAQTWLIAGETSEVGGAGDPGAGHISIVGRGIDAAARLPLLVTPGHALALSLALTRGRDPDAPRHLDQVVILEPG
jgi:glucosamine--fructose-6-phosphate aminotransferase (isomerizing)